MKKVVVLILLICMCVVPLFAATLVKVGEVDDFGDPTGKSYLTFDQDLSGTFKNSSTSGSLKWNVRIDPKSGKCTFILKERGEDVDVTTSTRSSYYVDSSIYYTVSFKKASDGSIEAMYGKLEKTETYKMNALVLYESVRLGYSKLDCRDFFSSDESFKVSIKSDYGSYTLGTLDMSEFSALVYDDSFPALVYDDSLYNEGVQLMEAGKYQEALDVFEKYKATDAVSYAHFKTDEQVDKCKNALRYYVGDIGPAGGYVFYDKGEYSDGWRYLEAAPADLRVVGGVLTVDATVSGYDNAEGYYIFGYYRAYASGSNQKADTSTAIGSGKSNTESLVDAMGDKAYARSSGAATTSDYAARLCSMLEYEHDGKVYGDWFLPSKDELDLMYVKLEWWYGLGSFADDAYWSSSESSADLAWLQGFDYGLWYDYRRSYLRRVRPVRAF